MNKIFKKTLSANDVGSTGAHQGGILVPKSDSELLAFFPELDRTTKNPDTWIECMDEDGLTRKFRFVYYNNKLHDSHGTRNEYRITYMTTYFKSISAKEGDTFEISRDDHETTYKIKVISCATVISEEESNTPVRIKLTSSWKRVH